MPRPFNRYPIGLLGLLDAKVQGKTPRELEDTTRAVVELTPFLLEQGIESLNDLTAAIGAVGRFFGANATLTVPDSELWYIHAFSVRPSAVLGAGTTLSVQGVHETALAVGVSAQCLYIRTEVQRGTVGLQPFAGNGMPFLMSPGDRLGVYVAEIVVGVNPQVQLFAKLTRLRI